MRRVFQIERENQNIQTAVFFPVKFRFTLVLRPLSMVQYQQKGHSAGLKYETCRFGLLRYRTLQVPAQG